MRRMYSENQIKKFSKDSVEESSKIELSGNLIVDGVIEEKTPYVDIPVEFAPTLNGLTKDFSFGRLKSNLHSLMIVLCGKYTNNTENSIEMSGKFVEWTKELPDNICKNIYRLDGTSIDEDYISSPLIASGIGIIKIVDSNAFQTFRFSLSCSTNKYLQMDFIMNNTETIEIPSTKELTFDGRMMIML